MTSAELKVPARSIVLVTVSKDVNLTKALIDVLRGILARQSTAVLTLSSRPVQHFIRKAKELDLDIDLQLKQKRLKIVDCMSRYIGDQGEELPGIFYASSPSDLSELALTTSEAISSAADKGEKWLMLDSVSTLLLYNTTGGLLRFLHFLLSKLRVMEFGGVIIVVRDELSDPMVQSLKQYCDSIITVES